MQRTSKTAIESSKKNSLLVYEDSQNVRERRREEVSDKGLEDYFIEEELVRAKQRISQEQADRVDPITYLIKEVSQIIMGYLSVSDLANSQLVSREWKQASREALIEYLKSSGKLLEGEEIRVQVGMEVREYGSIQRQLVEIVKATREDEGIAVAAANAMTLLNGARVSFSGMDLRGVRIAGAILDRAVMDGVNLEGADLQGVRLRSAWLRNANLTGSNLGNVEFGQLPKKNLDRNTWCCSYSSDGKYRASGGMDKIVRVWEVESGKCLHSLSGHENWVYNVAFSLDGRLLASGSGDTTVRVWGVQSGQCLHLLSGHKDSVTSVAFSLDGRLLASGGYDKTVRVWEVESGKCLHSLSKHEDMVDSVALRLDGRFLASGGYDKTVRVWEVESGKCLHSLSGHESHVKSVALSLDGRLLASGSGDTTVRVWRVESGKCLHSLLGHKDELYSVALSLDGRLLASGSYDKTVRVWEVESGKCLHTLRGYSSVIRQVQFSHDGQLICYAEGTWRWQFDEQGKTFRLQSTTSPVFNAEGLNLEGVTHLSKKNLHFLQQYGAIG